MKSIIRQDMGEDWNEFVAGLTNEEGVVALDAKPTAEEICRFDKKR